MTILAIISLLLLAATWFGPKLIEHGVGWIFEEPQQ